jgi:hypothetical protein
MFLKRMAKITEKVSDRREEIMDDRGPEKTLEYQMYYGNK